MNTLSNGADGKPAKRSRKQQISKSFFLRNPLTANIRALRCWGISERQTNQQQKALLEKQMYRTLLVRPNVAKPLVK